MKFKRFIQAVSAFGLLCSMCACSGSGTSDDNSDAGSDAAAEASDAASTDYADADKVAQIEETLNLANNEDQEWTYDSSTDSWSLTPVCAVAYPQIEDQEGVSVNVPGSYVMGIDTDGDGEADTDSSSVSGSVKGSLVIDTESSVTSENGQTYTASTAPIILTTGAAGYSSQTNSAATGEYAADGYISVVCGNRGKQSSYTDEDGNTVYIGDAPDCLVDQKAAARYVKYNILLGNLPGNVDYLVSTGGSGGGAHAVMFAATSDNPDFYAYQAEVGAVGVYELEDGSYTTTIVLDNKDIQLSDGAWGCVAYSPITSLAEGDMTLAFEYYLNPDYDFSTDFQKQLASYLSESYMDYINDQNLSVNEGDIDLDINADGDKDDTIELSIEYDPDNYPETNGYYGTYLDLYLAEFVSNLQWYVDNLDYAEDWTWFDEDGNPLSDEEVAAMTSEEKTAAYIEGRYAESFASSGGPGGMMGGNMNGAKPDGDIDAAGAPGGLPDGGMNTGTAPADMQSGVPDDLPDGDLPDDLNTGAAPADIQGGRPDGDMNTGDTPLVGTPDAGTTQAAGSNIDSSNYADYASMLEAYQTDIESVEAGDEYGNNIVELYNPLNYIGAEGTENPTWVRIVMGASEGDMSLMASLNLEIAFLNAGVNSILEWQWNGGHVPSEIFGNSLSLWVDQMYGEYVDGAAAITKAAAEAQTTNGTATEATGTDLTSWVTDDNGIVSFDISDAAVYRTSSASKAMPGFDVIDYGQEDYEFGNSTQNARHWDKYVLEILEKYQEELEPLFTTSSS